MKKIKPLYIVLIIIAIIILVAGVFLASFYFSLDSYGKNETAHMKDEAPLAFEIKKGDTLSSISGRLVEQEVIKNDFVFKLVAKKNDIGSAFQPGYYELSWGNSYLEIMQELMAEPIKIKVVIPEYFNALQTAEKFEELGLCKAEELLEYLQTKSFDYRFAKALPVDRAYRYEGYMYPATYQIEKGRTAQEIGDLLISTFNSYFTKDRYKKAKKLGYTVDEIVTLASIVEREAANADEFRTVAGIFINRLRDSQKLESCATVQYIFATDDDPDTNPKERLSGEDIQTESLYNTYKYAGLPKGPICSPGIQAIDAVLNYEQHSYKYMVLKPDGTHHFSETYAEHSAKVAEYLD